MRRVRLRTLLVILVLVTTVPLAVFAAWLVRRSSAQQAALVSQQNVDQARAIMVAIDQEIDATIESLNVLGLLEPIDDPDKTQFAQVAAKVLPLHPGWQNIALIDTSLRVIASTAG